MPQIGQIRAVTYLANNSGLRVKIQVIGCPLSLVMVAITLLGGLVKWITRDRLGRDKQGVPQQ